MNNSFRIDKLECVMFKRNFMLQNIYQKNGCQCTIWIEPCNFYKSYGKHLSEIVYYNEWILFNQMLLNIQILK